MKLLTTPMTAGTALATSTATFTSATSSDSYLATSTVPILSKAYPVCKGVDHCDFQNCKQPICSSWTHDWILCGLADGMYFHQVSEDKVLFKHRMV